MRSKEPCSSSLSFLALLAECQRSGIDPGKVIAKVGLEQSVLSDRDAQLPVRYLISVIHEIEEQGGDGAFALRAAENLPMGGYGVVDFIVCNAPTTGASFRQLIRYFRVLTEALTLSYEETDDVAWIRADVSAQCHPIEQFLVDFTFACIVTRSRYYHPGVFAIKEVRFRYGKPVSTHAHDRVFGAPIGYDRGFNGLAFCSDVVQAPLPNASAPLADILEPLGRQMLLGLPDSAAVSRQVRQELRDSFIHQRTPSISDIAKRIGMSRRSVQRRLAAEGVTFETLHDETRKGLAINWLGESSLSIAEVAFLLGFSVPSAFCRAVKRWTGRTPQSLRRTGMSWSKPSPP